MVRAENFEISTYRLKAGCSASELCPRWGGVQDRTRTGDPRGHIPLRCQLRHLHQKKKKLVAAAGIEPATCALSRHCSTTELCGYEKRLVPRPGGRTRDDAINSRALYQLSYRGTENQTNSPLAAFADALIQVALIPCLSLLLRGVTMPRATGGDDASQEGANNAFAGFGRPRGDRCVSGCHGKSP